MFCQTPTIQWERSYGGTSSDYIYSILQLTDNGFAMVGAVLSFDGDVVGNHGHSDAWYLEIDSAGSIKRSKCFGGSDYDGAFSLDTVRNNGFYIGGITSSCDGDISHCIGGADYWVLRVDSNLNILWEKTFGGTDEDELRSIKTTPDGGCVLFGYTLSVDGDISGAHGCSGCTPDFWIAKIDSLGNLQWNRALGGTGYEWGNSIALSSDGGYVMAGNATLVNGDITASNGLSDYWVIKLNSLGQLVWQHCLGGSLEDLAKSILATRDGGYMVSGSTLSSDGDVSTNHGYEDNWIVKLDSIGQIIWKCSLGGSNAERGVSVQEDSDGSYLVLSETLSSNGQVTGFHGYNDYWVSKIDSIGNLLWQKTLGGSYFDNPTALLILNDADCIVVGYSNSVDGDITGNHGGIDCTQSENCLDGWIVKLSVTTAIPQIQNKKYINVFPNPFDSYISLDNLLPGEVISIQDMLGIQIKKITARNTIEKIELNNCSSGAYLIKVGENSWRYIIKI